jgi:hypothetical protein
MSTIGRFSAALWLLGLGFVVLFVWQWALGALDATEVVVFTIAAAVIAILFAIRQVRIHRALHDHDHPDHRHLMDGLHVHREKRGF